MINSKISVVIITSLFLILFHYLKRNDELIQEMEMKQLSWPTLGVMYKIKPTSAGYIIGGFEGDMVSEYMFLNDGEFEDLIPWVDSLDNGGKLLDVGANMGSVSLYASYKKYDVVSLEMQVDVCKSLNFLKHINGFNNWRIVNAVLSDTPGLKYSYNDNQSNKGGVSAKIGDTGVSSVNFKLLSDLFGPFTFIKIDIEGHEDKLINVDNMELITKYTNNLHMELRVNQLHIFKLLMSGGYKMRTNYCRGCESYTLAEAYEEILRTLQSVNLMDNDCYCNVWFTKM